MFFYKTPFIVGVGVVEKGLRRLTEEEKKRCDPIYQDATCNSFENVVVFFPSSIWVWSDNEMIHKDEFFQITGSELTHYVIVEPENVLRIFKMVSDHGNATCGNRK